MGKGKIDCPDHSAGFELHAKTHKSDAGEKRQIELDDMLVVWALQNQHAQQMRAAACYHHCLT